MTKLEQLQQELAEVNNTRCNNLKELGSAINKRKELENLILTLKDSKK